MHALLRSRWFPLMATLLFCFGAMVPARAELTMEEIVENVRRNEALYENIDLRIRCEYTIGGRNPATFDNSGMNEIVSKSVTTHSVAQGAMLRVDVEQDEKTATKQSERDRRSAFDGTTTRIHFQGHYGNLLRERRRDHEFLFPHMLLMHHRYYNVPLSVYLTGDIAIKADPSAKWAEGVTLESQYGGEVQENGHLCHKVICTARLASGQEYYRDELSLAEDRNYLPIRLISYSLTASTTVPGFDGMVSEIREVEPGVWFPYAAICNRYNKSSLMSEGRQELRWRRTYAVEDASLRPEYPPSYFTDVTFPDGTPVYEVERGQVVRGYRQGAPSDVASATKLLTGKWGILMANSCVAAVVIIIIVGRVMYRRRQHARI